MSDREGLCERLCLLIGADAARIADYGTLYLIVGYNRRSEGEWTRNGEPYDFDYLEERVVASGETETELVESAEKYRRVLDGGWEEVFRQRGIELPPEQLEMVRDADRARREATP